MIQGTESDACVTRQPTGIPGLDAIAGGGLTQGRTTLVAGTSGSAKTVLAVEFLVRGIEDFGQNGVLITLEETPEDVARNARSMGWDLYEHVAQGRLAFVDAAFLFSQETVEIGSPLRRW